MDQRAACHTLSNAFLKSTKTWKRSCWCWRYLSHSILRLKICSVVLRPGLNPACSSAMFLRYDQSFAWLQRIFIVQKRRQKPKQTVSKHMKFGILLLIGEGIIPCLLRLAVYGEYEESPQSFRLPPENMFPSLVMKTIPQLSGNLTNGNTILELSNSSSIAKHTQILSINHRGLHKPSICPTRAKHYCHKKKDGCKRFCICR